MSVIAGIISPEREGDRLTRRAEEILRDNQRQIFVRTDRLFAVLLNLEWLAAVVIAVCLTPSTWDGAEGTLHPHVALAVLMGGALCAVPGALAWRYPGEPVTRYSIAIAQTMFSTLFIHVTGGRIETHFHVFVSLAILAAYRDWKLYIPVTAYVAADHLIRGIYWPLSTYGVLTASPWRSVEHAAWVLFEDVFVILSIRQSVREMRQHALSAAQMENSHAELKKYSEQLASSYDKERAIIEGALDAIVQMDCNGRVTSWNSEAERTFGWSSSESLGRPAAELFLPDRLRAQYSAALGAYRDAGRDELLNRRIESEGLHRDGREFPIEMAIATIRAGADTLFCAFIRDITARKRNEEEMQRAKEQAETANRTKSEFLANMSHEIRTPLNGILGFTELLIRNADQGNEAERRDYIRTIRSSGKHLLELINDILDLSKIEAGQMQVELTACPPHQLIAEVVSVLRARAQEKGITLDYRWASEIPDTIQTDPYRLRQLLMNLVGNAVKFTAKGSVHIVSQLVKQGDAPRLVIEVRDSGIGISNEHLESIFQPFVQADNSVTRQFGGTGLGLAISRNICESLGGSLTVQSELGHGSTFTAILPTGDLSGVHLGDRPANHHSGDIIDTREGSVNLAGVRVLLADDGDTNRKLIQLFLSRQGAEVTAVENGELAVAATMSQEFDVILMDMQMPVMDGYAATRKLRDGGYAKPIIALTAHAMLGDRKKCEESGCSGYVSKPVNVDELVRVVLSAAKSKQPTPSTGPRDARVATPSSHAGSAIHSTLPTDDPEIRELIAEFAATVPERIEALEQALQAEDYDAIARLAHALKGAGGTAGFASLSEVSRRIEESAQRRQPDGVDGRIHELRNIHERIVV